MDRPESPTKPRSGHLPDTRLKSYYLKELADIRVAEGELFNRLDNPNF
jgi:hypothetical protein